jgi:hypothetical protein
MPAGDFDGDNGSVGNGSSVTIQPGSAGVVWSVREVGAAGAWELWSTDGTNETRIYTAATATTLTNRQLIATYGDYYYLKNVSGGTVKYTFKYVVMK